MKLISKNRVANRFVSIVLIFVMTVAGIGFIDLPLLSRAELDRKSTRLNSSHGS